MRLSPLRLAQDATTHVHLLPRFLILLTACLRLTTSFSIRFTPSRPICTSHNLASADDEIEIEDFAWDAVAKVFHSPCPCGDRFEISRLQLSRGEDTATCPSCSLIVRVVYDLMDFEDYVESDGEEEVVDEKQGMEQPAVVEVAA